LDELNRLRAAGDAAGEAQLVAKRKTFLETKGKSTGGLTAEEATQLGNVNGTNLLSQLDLSKEEQRALLRAAMDSAGTGKIAHHLIPLEAIDEFKDLMQKAARGGFDFNGKGNGILLDALEQAVSNLKRNLGPKKGA
jgi:hypothetical protein